LRLDLAEGRARREEWLTAMVHFDLSVDGEPLGTFTVDMKLTQGSAAEIESVEVGPSTPLGEGPPHGKRSIPAGRSRTRRVSTSSVS
jgi:hypothetical protein